MSVEIQTPAIEAIEENEVASDTHGIVAGNLLASIWFYLKQNKIGWVFSAQTDFTLPGIGTRRPDVAFVTLEKLPKPKDDEVPFAPDLAAEVISRTDDWSAVVDKAKQYIQAGTRLVWAVDQYTPSVIVSRPNAPTIMLTSNDELDGEDVLPGFRLKISELFQ